MREHYSGVKTPLLNFCDILLDIIEIKDFELMKLISEKYARQIARDPYFIDVPSYILNLPLVFG